MFTAGDPDGLRSRSSPPPGPTSSAEWARPVETRAQLRVGPRLGDDPGLVLTTTRRPSAVLRGVMTKEAGRGRPDRADALIRAFTALRLERGAGAPRMGVV